MKNKTLIWLDIETTGTRVKSNAILQIAILITDQELKPLKKPFNIIVRNSKKKLLEIGRWAWVNHTENGLLDKSKKSKINLKQAEKLCIDYIKEANLYEEKIICGNSIAFDMNFLKTYMPEFSHLYLKRASLLDISSFKILKEIQYPNIKSYQKKEFHTADSDILETIEEYKYYKENLFQ